MQREFKSIPPPAGPKLPSRRTLADMEPARDKVFKHTPTTLEWVNALELEGTEKHPEMKAALNHNGHTFTCPVTLQTLPITQAHEVTLKQLLAWHYTQEGESSLLASTCISTSTAKRRSTVPSVIKRAVPQIKAREYVRVAHRPDFLMSRAFVSQAAAILLLKAAVEVRTRNVLRRVLPLHLFWGFHCCQ